MKTLSFRIDEKEDRDLDSIAMKLKTDKSTVARRVIELGKGHKKKGHFGKLPATVMWDIEHF
ncbi:MAG: hypothetical protein ACOC44_12820 [Promethearchaeia archaeon]